MKINDGFKIDDAPSGLRLSVVPGKKLDRLHIEITEAAPVVGNRDFFFTRDGGFDGTGSGIGCPSEDIPAQAVEGLHRGQGSAAIERDPWAHRSEEMRCHSCMFYVPKITTPGLAPVAAAEVGRCRRHAPTMGGYPPVFPRSDWCGDHKVDEGKV